MDKCKKCREDVNLRGNIGVEFKRHSKWMFEVYSTLLFYFDWQNKCFLLCCSPKYIISNSILNNDQNAKLLYLI